MLKYKVSFDGDAFRSVDRQVEIPCIVIKNLALFTSKGSRVGAWDGKMLTLGASGAIGNLSKVRIPIMYSASSTFFLFIP